MSILDILHAAHSNRSQIYTGGAGEGGFQRKSENAPQTALVNTNQPFKYKVVSSLAAYAT